VSTIPQGALPWGVGGLKIDLLGSPETVSGRAVGVGVNVGVGVFVGDGVLVGVPVSVGGKVVVGVKVGVSDAPTSFAAPSL
jgi:hypothetical protein